MIIQTCEQYTAEWWDGRRGLPTASCADKIVTPTGKLSAQSRGYINELIAAKLGFADEAIEPTEWMARGIELEPEARAFYEFTTDETVEQVGFITDDDITAGCSPDGLIYGGPGQRVMDISKGWEVKCPKASTHVGYLLGGTLPDYYKPQVHFSMAVTGLSEWVFMSYFPGMDPLIITVKSDAYTDNVAAAIQGFVAQLREAQKRLGIEA